MIDNKKILLYEIARNTAIICDGLASKSSVIVRNNVIKLAISYLEENKESLSLSSEDIEEMKKSLTNHYDVLLLKCRKKVI